MIKSGDAVLKALESGGQTKFAGDLKSFMSKLNAADFKTKKAVVDQLRNFCASHSVRALKVGKLSPAEWWELLNEFDTELRRFLSSAEQTQIGKLKDSPGASTAICKKALVKTDWNLSKAKEVIDKSGRSRNV